MAGEGQQGQQGTEQQQQQQQGQPPAQGEQQQQQGQPPVQQQQQGQPPVQQQQQQPEANPDLAGYQTFTTPEGVEANLELQKKFAPIAKELGLTQEQAQKLVTLQGETEIARSQSQATEWQGVTDGWHKAAREDKEFGGVNFETNVDTAMKPLDTFLGKEDREKFEQELEATGMGNNPRLIRLLWKVGKAMSEGRMLTDGSGGGQGEKDPAKIMFPNQN